MSTADATLPETGPKPLLLLRRHPVAALVGAAALYHLLLHLAAGPARAAGAGSHLSAWSLAPLALLLPWAVWRCIALLGEEGISGDTPSRGVVYAHLGKLALQMLAFAAGVSLSGLWIFHRAMGVAELAEALPIPAVDWFFGLVLWGELLLIGGILLLLPIVQLGYVLSRLADGYRRLLHLWACILLVWAIFRVAPRLAELFTWLPDVTFRQIAAAGPRFRFAFAGVETAPFAATLLLSLLALVAASAILPVARRHVQNPPPKTRWSEPILERRPVTPREKILLTFMAVSFLSLFDIGTGGREVLRSLPGFYLQPPRANAVEAMLSPFIVDGGTLVDPEPEFRSLVVKTQGDLSIVPSRSGAFAAHYALWTTALNAQEAAAFGAEADVSLERSGSSAELVLNAPSASGERGLVRASYHLELPPGIALHLEGDGSNVSVHQTEGDIELAFSSGVLQLSEIRGNVRLVGDVGEVYLTNISGDVRLTQRDGLAEIHGVGGELHLDGEYLTAGVSDVAGPVTARLRRGSGSFAHLRKGLTLQAEMAEVSVGGVEGRVDYEGAISPARFAPLSGPAEVESDRGNILLQLDPATPWELKLSSTATIASSLPEEVAPAPERSGRITSLEAKVGEGGVPVTAVVKGAELRVETR